MCKTPERVEMNVIQTFYLKSLIRVATYNLTEHDRVVLIKNLKIKSVF